MSDKGTIVITGGSGYIGGYTLNHIIANDIADKVILLDIKQPRTEVWTEQVHSAYKNGKVLYQELDVRNAINIEDYDVSCIYNFAAIHREPGHEPYEYYETNIKGAQNVVDFAEKVGCNNILFTSSIAPYGHAEVARTESSQVVPYSPYGSSKLAAEKIHEGWQHANREERKLIIVRPGVIYGPHEDGNVPRLRGALKKGLFCYVGNKDVRKSGGYVKELVNTFFWVDQWMSDHDQNSALYNFSLPEPPTLEEYVNTILKVAGMRRWVPSLPYSAILAVSYVLESIATILRIKQPAHPDRIRKLKVDNMIIPQFLIDKEYPFHFNLEACLEDWKKDVPREW
tara:strand:+ start:12158 stop:13180 length:1023 start_codon:yes stop_codon:yes gene_type:complete